MRSKSIIQTQSALALVQGIIEQNCNQYIVIQIIFSQTFFSIHAHQHTSCPDTIFNFKIHGRNGVFKLVLFARRYALITKIP